MPKACRNPECVSGLTPGLISIGKGKLGPPAIGVDAVRNAITYRWGWVRCLACNRDAEKDRGVTYKHMSRTPQEIARRAQLATEKAPYKPDQVSSGVGAQLGGLAAIKAAAGSTQPGSAPDRETARQLALTNERLNQLLGTNTKLTEQIANMAEQISSLLNENRELKRALDGYAARYAQSQTAALPSPPP